MKSHTSNLVRLSLATTLLCVAAVTARADLFYGLSQNTLFSFDSASPAMVSGVHPITGLQGDTLISLDVRPASSQLYGLGSSLHLYILDPNTGSAALVNSAAIGSPTGSRFSLSFNPAASSATVLGLSGQNLSVAPNGTPGAVGSPLAYAVNDPNFGLDPAIAAAAFSHTGGPLFGIDSKRDTLVRLDLPSTGVARTVGLLGVNTTGDAALDISGLSGLAFASLTRAGEATSGLYRIDLQTGQATLVGAIGFSSPLVGLTSQVPEPSTCLLGVLGMAAVWLSRRRWDLRRRSAMVLNH